MFEQTPTWGWYVALANLTQWVHWPAWAAFFSLGALIWAINLANRNARDARAKDAVLLLAAASLCSLGVSNIQSYKRKVEEGKRTDYAHMARVFLKTWEAARIMERVNDFDNYRLPSPSTYSAFEKARLEFAHVLIDFQHSENVGAVAADYDAHIKVVNEVVDTLNREGAARMRRWS